MTGLCRTFTTAIPSGAFPSLRYIYRCAACTTWTRSNDERVDCPDCGQAMQKDMGLTPTVEDRNALGEQEYEDRNTSPDWEDEDLYGEWVG